MDIPTDRRTSPATWTLDSLLEAGAVAPDWAEALAPVADEVVEVGQLLAQRERSGETHQPTGATIWRAFQRPLAGVRVLILGQDPYPTPGHATGLSFSVPPELTKLPPSLRNIFQELETDLGQPQPRSGDLTSWADQGVMLLNTALTVPVNGKKSHLALGWRPITRRAVAALGERDGVVSVLWGNHAQKFSDSAPPAAVASSHPSPLSARHSFWGSKPFSTVNQHLPGAPVDWSLPPLPARKE